ncbi:HNH endonuclease [Flexivirga meconopsidis]|uniref:HNH endonuclease n=1 Tax=Flexivirga meconopsidis TaxID=2977121 RepID=UPI00223ECDBF|nr:HNH endonuclease [Flexivirga meconopsidis]
MSVLVLNAGYEPLHTVSIKHAMNMLWRGVATVEESHPEETFGPFPKPTVLRLVRYVKMTWAYAKRGGIKLTEVGVKITWEQFSHGTPTYSQAGVLKRDHGQCAYCGQPTATTMDHVLPKSRGGATSWENAVAACAPCNQRKADLTPDEAGMRLLWEPFVPTREDLAW